MTHGVIVMPFVTHVTYFKNKEISLFGHFDYK